MTKLQAPTPKGVKIRKQAARDGVQFNFVSPEGVPLSYIPLSNTGESMVVGPEKIDQIPPKLQASKPAEGFSSIGVKKDGSNLSVHNAGGQELVSHLPNVISAEPTPLKGPPPVKKSHEVVPNNFYVGDGCLKCVIYNLSLPQRPQIKQNLLKFFLRGLPTVDKIAHFTFVSPLCWLCRKAKESRVHLLEGCLKAKAILKTIRRRCFVLKIPGWKSADFVCGFMNQYLKKAEASAVSAALLNLWITVCAEGSKSPSFAVKIFDEIAKTNKMIPKQTRRKAPPKGKREVKQPKFKYPVLQVFYDGSGHVDPYIRGSGYVIIKEGLEVGGGFETILLDSNNLGEFLGCLAGLQQVIGFGQHVEMVGDCKILTEAVPKMKPINNFELNEILSEIRNIVESKFAKVEYTHVYCKFNKRSDAITMAASHFEEDGMEAVFDRNWDLRLKQLATTSEEWIIENSKLWKWVMELLDLDWSFPVKKVQFKRRFKNKMITINNVYFSVQTALDGVMISPVFISNDIVKWFPERAALGEMLESFVEKKN